MSHDPEHHHPLDEVPSSHREIDTPSPESYRAVPIRKANEARDSFQNSHRTLFGTASGNTKWNIRVSADPREWFYRATQTTQEKHGPPTPLQILGKDKSPQDRNIVTLTDVDVEACISAHWSENFPAQGWETAVNKAPLRMLVLGAEPIEPLAPADATWRIHAITRHLSDEKKYCGQPFFCHCLALGSHATVTDHADQTDALLEHLRKVSQDRMHGTSNPIVGWAETNKEIRWNARKAGQSLGIFGKIFTT
jgi:hypothetical protein